MRPTAMVMMLALLVPGRARAQYANPYGVVAGNRVRIDAPAFADRPLVGRLVAAGGDSLVLLASSSSATVRMPLGAVQGVAVSDGHDRAGSALRYGALGAFAGGVLTAASVSHDEPLAGFVGFFAGAVLGAPIGAAVGAIFAPERWREITLDGPQPSATTGSYHLAIDPGTDVRVALRTSPAHSVKTRIDLMAGDTLLLSKGGVDGLRRVQVADIAHLDVRGGKDRRRGVLYGAGAFGLITAVAGGIDYSHQNISGGDLVGTTIGNMVLGGLIGYALSPTGWEPVALPRR